MGHLRRIVVPALDLRVCTLPARTPMGCMSRSRCARPPTAPQAIQNALAVSTAERSKCLPSGSENDPTCGYKQPEGAYYGNIFATTPVNPPPSPTVGPDGGLVPYSGPAIGPIAQTPSFYACAGPESNIPEITKRFCSSQGDQSVIKVPGICVTSATESGVCDGMDATGSIYGCNTTTHSTQAGTHYDQVISVYLKQPLSACGNGVCEEGEATIDGPAYCPSDCHPDTWAETFGVDIFDSLGGLSSVSGLSADAVEPHKVAVDSHGSVIVADVVCNTSPLDLDPDDDPTNPIHTLAPDGVVGANLVLASYDVNGKYLWGVRTYLSSFSGAACVYGGGSSLGGARPIGTAVTRVNSVNVANDGTVTVVGNDYFEPAATPDNEVATWIAKFSGGSPPGLVSGWPVVINETQGASTVAPAGVDQDGNVAFAGQGIVGLPGLSGPPVGGGESVVVAKMWSDGNNHTGGPFAWGITEPQGQVTGVAFDPSGNVVTVLATSSGSNVYKLAGTDGHQIGAIDYTALPASDPTSGTQPQGVATDTDGSIYVAGSQCLNGEQECSLSLIKYASDSALTYLWSVKPNGLASSTSGSFGQYLALDGSGAVLVAGYASNTDFGAGLFETYAFPSVFVSAYSTAATLAAGQQRFLWAKKTPMILDSGLSGFGVGTGRVALAGGYSGSMQLDDLLLVNAIPELTNNHNAFVGSFAEPSSSDTTAPSVGAGTDQTGAPLNAVPLNIVVPATSAAGANVFFLPPTATDSGNAGTNVVCTPAPNTIFPLGTTLVSCVASDPLGNTSAPVTFTVTVVDTDGTDLHLLHASRTCAGDQQQWGDRVVRFAHGDRSGRRPDRTWQRSRARRHRAASFQWVGPCHVQCEQQSRRSLTDDVLHRGNAATFRAADGDMRRRSGARPSPSKQLWAFAASR